MPEDKKFNFTKKGLENLIPSLKDKEYYYDLEAIYYTP